MTVAVESQGSFEQDVALARSLDGVVVLHADEHECAVLSVDGDNQLRCGNHLAVKTFFERKEADGDPWFSFRGVAFVHEADVLASFGADQWEGAEELYESLVKPDAA